MTSRDIRDDEILRSHQLLALLDGKFSDVRPILLRAQINGGDVAVIVASMEDDDGNPVLEAVAVLVNETVMSILSPVEKLSP